MLVYEPLPKGPWIRLLTLRPATCEDDTSPIICTLWAAQLENAEYDAVSYVWGNSTAVREINCNRHAIAVTVSLYGALRKLQPPPGSADRTLWADAICIDQSNVAERNSQVGMMGAIYERARSVQIWLGKDMRGDARPAFELCNEIGAYYGDGYHSDDESIWYDWPPPPPPDAPFLQTARWKNLQTLSQLPWFTRLWVLQEAGLAQTAEAHWGSASIRFSEMIEAFTHINLHACFIPLVAEYGFDFSYVTDTWWQIWCTYDNTPSWRNECPYIHFTAVHPELRQRRDVFNVLYIGTKFKASDPHDYVYAHLGHPAVRRTDGASFVDVDYGKSLVELYRDVAEKLLDSKYGLLLLSAVEHRDEIPEPSWIPQWHQATDIGMIAPIPGFTRWYDASSSSPPKAEIVSTPNPTGSPRLHTRGILFDTISAMSTAFEQTAGTTSEHPVAAALALAQSPTDLETLDALSLILIAGMDGHSGNAAEDDLRKHRADFLAYCSSEPQLQPFRASIHAVYNTATTTTTTAAVGDGKEYKRNLEDYCHHRRLFRTASGRFGLGPAAMREGDRCAVLFGAGVPFVVRRWRSEYKLVGECYIHGVMRGEVVRGVGFEWRGGEDVVFV
ncbi:MAG: hypothetical protein Q9219_003783 [cf. Caloplaca sp. 3 TL-2023]